MKDRCCEGKYVNFFSTKLAFLIINKGGFSLEKEKIFTYSIELLISFMCSTASIIIISSVCGSIIYSLIFILVFAGIRFFSGGYHAKTYLRCFILTNIVFVVVLIVSHFERNYGSTLGLLILTWISMLLIVFLSPIQNRNHPLSRKRRTLNGVVSKLYAAIILALIHLMVLTEYNSFLFYLICTSFIAAAIMMIMPLFRKE